MRRVPWVLLCLGLAGWVTALVLGVRNGSLAEDRVFIAVASVAMYGWAVVGALLASRNPRNPIGWLMLVFGLGFLSSVFGSEWAVNALRTNPGNLPLGRWAAWYTNWSWLAAMAAVPLLLLLYPTGAVPSSRWRPVVWAVLAASALTALATMLLPGRIEVAGQFMIANPTGARALAGPAALVQTVVGIGFMVVLVPLCVLAPVLRFRRASGLERQQIRLLAYTAAVGGIAFLAAVVSGIGLEPNETNLVNEGAFWIVALAVGLGVPAAIGVALLKYRLWDLDLVLKKTLVAALVAILATLVGLALLTLGGRLVVGPVADSSAALLAAGVAIGLLFWPIRHLAGRIADRLVYGGRATPYEILTRFSSRMAETYSVEDVLARTAAVLGEGTGAEQASVWLSVGGEPRIEAVWPSGSRTPAALPDDAVPVAHQGEVLGALAVRMPANDPMNPSKERLVKDLAAQAGPVLRNVRLLEELRESRRRIVAAQDERAKKLERDLHDGAQQQLVALAVKLRLAQGLARRDPGKADAMLAELQAETNDALENLRDLARGIYPPLLADKGLAAALEAQARKSAVPVSVEADGIGRYPQEVEAAIYFCVLEGLQNVARYAGASRAIVRLTEADRSLGFEVQDDGRGFDPSTTPRGSGLQNMADRLDALGGELDVESNPGAGTTITGRAPVREGGS